MLVAVVVEAIAIVLLGVLVLGLLRSHALILKSLHELGAGLELEKEAGGAEAKKGPVHVDLETGVVTSERRAGALVGDISGANLVGASAQVAVGSGRTLLAFLTSGCSVCATFWQSFQGPVDVPGDARLVIVTKGDDEESASALRKLAAPDLDVVRSGAAWTDYDVPGSPYFVMIEDGVVVGEGSATSWPQVSDLMSQAVQDAEDRAAAEKTPGSVSGGDFVDRGERDNPSRMDAELRAAGIGPGHPSLSEPPESGSA